MLPQIFGIGTEASVLTIVELCGYKEYLHLLAVSIEEFKWNANMGL